jgi:hypothetical protein
MVLRATGDSRSRLYGGLVMLGDKWEPAVGKLLSVRHDSSPHYLMEVRPLSGGEAFRCECESPSLMLSSFMRPPFNTEIKMECIPGKKKARFDRSEPAINRRTYERADYDRHQELLHQTPDAAAGDMVEQLAKLSEMHVAGQITDLQFEAGKALIISTAEQRNEL